MTDSEKLDLILKKLEEHDQRFDSMDSRFNKIESELQDMKDMDRMIFDELERVHTKLLDKTIELEKKIG